MVDINDSIALSISVLALLSIISISLLVCMILVYWRYRSKEKEKTIWFNSPSELRTGWLSDDRKCLVPGTFSAKVVQPGLLQTEDSASQTEVVSSSNTDSHKTSVAGVSPCGKISFILRYLSEREELMVRLIHLEGFSCGDSVYNADSAYVDVLLTQIGTKGKGTADNPPKLDLALQQVYYFIISQDQLFSYKLVFKVNTFDESFRRTVSGEVEIDLFDELKKHIFTGAEVILSKDIQPVSHESSSSRKSSVENLHWKLYPNVDEADDVEVERTMMASPLSWDDECNISSKSSFGVAPYEDLSSGGVQWHRLSGDSWEEQLAVQWPHLSDSVVSVPSSFQFMEKTVDIDFGEKSTEDVDDSADSLPLRRSVSESYIPHYGRLSPPPKNFYHLVPTVVASKGLRTAVDNPSIRKKPATWSHRKIPGQVVNFDRQEKEKLCRKRSVSLPSLSDIPLVTNDKHEDFIY